MYLPNLYKCFSLETRIGIVQILKVEPAEREDKGKFYVGLI